jgi:hypothetical protein
MTEQQPNQQPNNDGSGAGNQPTGGEGGHGTPAKPDGGTSHPQPSKGAPATPQVPESYDLKVPEGMEIEDAYVKSVAEYAKKHSLTNDQAQSVLNRELNLRASIIKGHEEELEQNAETWLNASETDGEIGGEAFQENVTLAKRVIDKFATPAFVNALNETGLGNHPEVIRIFHRIGKNLKDDSIVFPKTEGGKQEKSLEEVFYGDSQNNNNKE